MSNYIDFVPVPEQISSTSGTKKVTSIETDAFVEITAGSFSHRMHTDGNVDFNIGNGDSFNIISNSTTTDFGLDITNTNSNDVRLALSNSSRTYSVGIDQSVANTFRISNGSTDLSADPLLTLDQTGKLALGISGSAIPRAMLDVRGSAIFGARTITAGTTTISADSDNILMCDASSGIVTVELPDPADSVGMIFTIIKLDNTANNIQITSVSSDTINGIAQFDLSNQFDSITIVRRDGANWTTASKSIADLSNPLFTDGTASTPSIAFASDIDTGLFRVSSGQIGITVNGTQTINIASQGIVAQNTSGTSYGTGTNSVAYDIQTPTNASATWLMTHHNDDTSFRTGIQSLNNSNIMRLYAGSTFLELSSSSIQVSVSGTVTNPAYSFNVDPNTGIYRIGENIVGFAAGGIEAFRYNGTGIKALNGSASFPSYSFATDANTGIYRSLSDQIDFTTGGTRRAYINNGGLVVISGVGLFPAGSQVAPSIAFASDSNTGFYNVASNRLGFVTNGSLRAEFTTTGLTFATGNSIFLSNGSAASPSIRFNSDQDTGMFLNASGQLGMTVGGTSIARYTSAGLTIDSGNVRTSNGTSSSPSFSFASDVNTGFFSPSSDQIGIVVGGTQRATWITSGLSLLTNRITNLGTPISGTDAATKTYVDGLTNATPTFPSGSAAAPSISFDTDSDTGLYRAAADQLGLAAGGANVVLINSNSLQMVSGRQLLIGSGTTAIPGIAFAGDTNTGFNSSGANLLSVVVAGGIRGNWSTTGLDLINHRITNVATPTSPGDATTKAYVDGLTNATATFPNGSVSLPGIAFDTDLDTGFYRSTSNHLSVTAGGTYCGNFTSNGLELPTGRQLTLPTGSASAPSLTFSGDSNTGIHQPLTDRIRFACGGVDQAEFTTAGFRMLTSQLQVVDGSATSPSYSFSGDVDTGFYRPGTNQIAMTFGGNRPYTFNASGIALAGSTDSFSIGGTTTRSSKLEFNMINDSISTLTISGENTSAAANGTVRSRLYFREALGGSGPSGRGHGLIDGLVESGDNNDYNSNLVFSVWEDVPTNGVSSFKEVLRLKENGVHLTNHETTGSASNAYIDLSTGQLLRSTSSERYKKDIFELTDEMADKVFDMLPVTYFSDIANDNQSERHLGFTAEQLDSIGLHELVVYKDYGDGLIPEAVNYDRVSVLLTYIIKKQHKDLTEMKETILPNLAFDLLELRKELNELKANLK